MAHTAKLSLKAHRALRLIAKRTGMKMFTANEQAILEKLARLNEARQILKEGGRDQ